MSELERLARVLLRERYGWTDRELAAASATDIALAGDEVRAILRELREPTEDMQVAGVMALAEVMEKERAHWEKPESQQLINRQLARTPDTPILPTATLPVVSSNESDPVFRAIIDHILSEGNT